MRISDFIDATNKACSPEEIFALYQRATADLGFDRIMYSALTPHSVYDAIETPCVMRNYPDDWIEHYVASGYIQADPVRTQGIRSAFPFVWSDMMETRKLRKEEKRVMVEAQDAGLLDGVGIPFHGPYGEVMGVGLASSLGGTDAARNLSALHALSVQFHTAYTALALPQLADLPEVRLTAREAEVLRWCALGKSNWAIGEILGISQHGVEFHMRNVLTKRNADCRVTAVVKALRLHLITL